MVQQKQNQESTQLDQMVFFQNLIPGKQQSPLIDHFREKCIDTEENEEIRKQREILLMKSPPILSFRNEQQKVQFYDDEAKKCQKGEVQFCCGEVKPTSEASSTFLPKDDYVFSSDNQFYTGSAKTITDTMQQNIESIDNSTQIEVFNSAIVNLGRDKLPMSSLKSTPSVENILGEDVGLQTKDNNKSSDKENVNELGSNEGLDSKRPK